MSQATCDMYLMMFFCKYRPSPLPQHPWYFLYRETKPITPKPIVFYIERETKPMVFVFYIQIPSPLPSHIKLLMTSLSVCAVHAPLLLQSVHTYPNVCIPCILKCLTLHLIVIAELQLVNLSRSYFTFKDPTTTLT